MMTWRAPVSPMVLTSPASSDGAGLKVKREGDGKAVFARRYSGSVTRTIEDIPPPASVWLLAESAYHMRDAHSRLQHGPAREILSFCRAHRPRGRGVGGRGSGREPEPDRFRPDDTGVDRL